METVEQFLKKKIDKMDLNSAEKDLAFNIMIRTHNNVISDLWNK